MVEEVRTLGATRAQVDALMAGLAQPLLPEQSARERADLLLSLIEDAHLSSLLGSSGRTVRHAALEALVALGYPYALEVPPEALPPTWQLSREPDKRRKPLSTRGWVGFGIIALTAVVPMIPAFGSMSRSGRWDLFLLLILAFDIGVILLPAVLAALGHYFRIRILKGLGIAGQLIYALLFAVPSLPSAIATGSASSVRAVLIGGLLLLGTGLMNFRSES